MESLNRVVNKGLSPITSSKSILSIVSLFLVLYVALARPKLPNSLKTLFMNPVFRLVAIAYIIFRGNQSPKTSLIIAALFLLTMHLINKDEVENLGQQKKNSKK